MCVAILPPDPGVATQQVSAPFLLCWQLSFDFFRHASLEYSSSFQTPSSLSFSTIGEHGMEGLFLECYNTVHVSLKQQKFGTTKFILTNNFSF